MKTSITMLAFATVFLLIWLVLGTIGYLLTDPEITMKDCMRHPIVLLVMFVFGWFPAFAVADEVYQNQNQLNK
jgi:hypothetical protein